MSTGTHPDDSNRHDGGGPRSLVFHPDGKTLFSVQELDHTIAAYSFDAGTGKLALIGAAQQTVPQAWLDSNPPCPYMYNAQANYNSGIALAPDGRHVYVTGRGMDNVAGFSVAADGGLSPTAQATVPSGGRTPWSLSFVTDTLLVVTNQNADDPSAREGGGPDADPCVVSFSLVMWSIELTLPCYQEEQHLLGVWTGSSCPGLSTC